MAKRFTDYEKFMEPEYEEKDSMRNGRKNRNPKKKHTKDNKRQNKEIDWD